ncbi:hypothetical protein [Vibrio sp. 10N.261.51.F12]|uniref:hypothetical protein n=1 Tax=Vibrio sp. 10N.261.51.F12 TaxID=3229679 RepID=UPI00354DD707
MSNLTVEQENAIATFKAALHLPKGGFHVLIVDLCQQYQLPFQTCRSVLKKAQKSIESKIRDQYDELEPADLTQACWLALIHQSLSELAAQTQPLMVTMTSSERYTAIMSAMESPHVEASARDELIDKLMMVYELDVYKSLGAMLHTSALYWELRDDLFEMTADRLQKFSDYPQHVEATLHLLDLADRVRSPSVK